MKTTLGENTTFTFLCRSLSFVFNLSVPHVLIHQKKFNSKSKPLILLREENGMLFFQMFHQKTFYRVVIKGVLGGPWPPLLKFLFCCIFYRLCLVTENVI